VITKATNHDALMKVVWDLVGGCEAATVSACLLNSRGSANEIPHLLDS